MGKNSKFEQLQDLLEISNDLRLKKLWEVLSPFFQSYEQIVEAKKLDKEFYFNLLSQFCALIIEQIRNPCKFESYHVAVRSPVDYYTIGNEIFRPLVNMNDSTLKGKENLLKIEEFLAKRENVIFFANHQIEADPQALSLLLEDNFPKIAEEMIFVAGARVLTDPAAVPFSLGRFLFCIYSKKYFSAHEEQAAMMRTHNQRTLAEISNQLNLGGKCIYIAPSGGRDRKGASGRVEVAPFDPQSVELMYLLGRKSKQPTHFFPLALSTNAILPPPEGVQIDLGEMRSTNEAPIHAYFGNEIDMENFPHDETIIKAKKKDERTQYIYNLVREMYDEFPANSQLR